MLNAFKRILHLLYVVYAFTLFFLLMIPVFFWSLFAAPFGRVRGGNMVYGACVVWADVWFFLIAIPHRNTYLQHVNPGRSYIFVANHVSYLDAALIPKVFRRSVRPLGKVEMSRVPVFGTIYKNAIVTVDRSNPVNRARSVEEMKFLLAHRISILVFPEGTFNETNHPLKEFYDGAFRIAIETGTTIIPVVILDTYDRMHQASVFSLNPGKSRAVFLPEVSVEGLTHEHIASLRQTVFNVMSAALREHGASWISDNGEQQPG